MVKVGLSDRVDLWIFWKGTPGNGREFTASPSATICRVHELERTLEITCLGMGYTVLICQPWSGWSGWSPLAAQAVRNRKLRRTKGAEQRGH